MDRDQPESDATYRISLSPSYLARAIAARSYVTLKRALAPHGLSPIGWRILAGLHERDDRNIADLAEHTATDRSNLGRAIHEMEKEGLVLRRPAPRDRRNIVVGLTAMGRQKFLAAVPVVRAVNDHMLDDLDETEKANAVKLMRRMLGSAQRPFDVDP